MRLVVVTGGGSGIGRAIAERFRAAGERVVAVGRGSSAVDEICDVTDERGVESLFARLGDVDVLVNNAGVAESEPLQRTTLEQWRRHLDVNVTGPFFCTRAVLPAMVERNRGRIVTVAMTERTIARIVERTGRTVEDSRAAILATSPLGRLVEPEEVATAVCYLASDEAAGINGQALVLDGGSIQR